MELENLINMNTKLSIILSARNEEEIIKKTLNEILGYLRNKKYTYEILIVLFLHRLHNFARVIIGRFV